MNRRDFVKSGATVLAGASLGGATSEKVDAREQNQSPGIDFDFCGLFGFMLTQDKELRVLLVHAKNASLKDDHAPLLMMPFKAYAPDDISPSQRHHPPNIVRIGKDPDRAMAVWSLTAKRLWLPSAHPEFEDPDPQASLKFDKSPIDVAKGPWPRNDDEQWKSYLWFVKLEDLIKTSNRGGPGKLKCNAKTITSTIRLTRGDAAGRAPLTPCEQERRYILDGDRERARHFATQMHVVYGHSAGTAKLAIYDEKSKETRFIGVSVSNGLTPVTISNSPMTHDTPDHYRAFYKMVGKSGKEVEHTPQMCFQDEHKMQAKDSIRAAPYPDCIPPSVPPPDPN